MINESTFNVKLMNQIIIQHFCWDTDKVLFQAKLNLHQAVIN